MNLQLFMENNWMNVRTKFKLQLIKKILDAIYKDSTEITRLDRKYQIYRKYYDIEVRNVIQYNLNTDEQIGRYDSLSNAARKNDIKHTTTIGLCCRGLKKDAHGYKWKYVTSRHLEG